MLFRLYGNQSIVSKMDEKDYTTFTIAIKKDDLEKFRHNIELACAFAVLKNKVPSILFFRICDAIKEPDDIKNEVLLQKHIDVATKADAYFKKYKDYNFEGKYSIEIIELPNKIYANYANFPPPNDGEPDLKYKKRVMEYVKAQKYQQYSVRDMCLTCLKEFEVNKRKLSKITAIKFFYKSITKYSERFNKAHKKAFKPYKRTVIATFIANELGFLEPYLENPTNPKLEDKGKYAIRTLKKP